MITVCLCGHEAVIHVITKVCRLCGYTKKGIKKKGIEKTNTRTITESDYNPPNSEWAYDGEKARLWALAVYGCSCESCCTQAAIENRTRAKV